MPHLYTLFFSLLIYFHQRFCVVLLISRNIQLLTQFHVLCFRFCAASTQVELLEVSGEPRGQSGPLLEDQRAHGEHPAGNHSTGARNHREETWGAMMAAGGWWIGRFTGAASISRPD